jgi:hypothetical protein
MLTIPSAIRQKSPLHEGQSLVIRVQVLVVEILPALSPDDLFIRYPTNEPIDDAQWHHDMANTMTANQERKETG